MARKFLGTIKTGLTAPSSYTPSQDRPARIGNVDAAYAGTGLAKVLLDGETVMGSKGYSWLGPYEPEAGDRVVLLPVGRGYIIAGLIQTSPADTDRPYASADKTTAANAVATAASPAWDTVVVQGGITYNATTKKFTMPRAGLLHVDAMMTLSESITDGNTYVNIVQNGTDVAHAAQTLGSVSGGTQYGSINRTLPVAAGDTIEVWYRSQNTAALAVGNLANFVTMAYL